jgi:hypothetical protein
MRKNFMPVSIVVILLTAAGCRTNPDPLWSTIGASPTQSSPETLLNHLAGQWTLTGAFGGAATAHEIDARWVLNHEYLIFRETSRDRTTNGQPAYEAIVLLSENPKSGDCSCLWLDNTSPNGLSSGIVARGQATADTLPFLFQYPTNGTLHTTFHYFATTDTWQWTIESDQDGKHETFGRATLIRKRKRS